jgi:heptosyltransferase II
VNWLGDAVMTTPALGAVRAAFPEDVLTLVARPAVAELFRHHPHVDEIVVYDKPGKHAGAAGTVRLARELRRRRCGRAILFQNAFNAALLAFLAGVPDRWGYATDGRRFLLSRAVAVTEEALSLHHVEYYLRLVSDLGIPRPASPAMRLHVTDAERAAMRARLAGLGVPEERRILGINPGATYGSAKRWYPERFAAAADALSEEWGAAVVLMGTRPEMPIAGEIAAAMRRRPVDLSGRTSVRELMALLSLCTFLVTNDSGPMHIAAAEGVPLAAVFGPTNPRTTSPWTPLAKVVRVDVDCSPCLLRKCDRGHECMRGVTADMVVSAARNLMAEAARGLA